MHQVDKTILIAAYKLAGRAWSQSEQIWGLLRSYELESQNYPNNSFKLFYIQNFKMKYWNKWNKINLF